MPHLNVAAWSLGNVDRTIRSSRTNEKKKKKKKRKRLAREGFYNGASMSSLN